MKQPSRLARFEQALVHWFLAPGPITNLVVVRIGLGLVLLASVLQYWPDIHWHWGYDGLLAHFIPSDYGDHPLRHHTTLIFATLGVSATMFALGFATRVSGLVAACMQAIVASTWYLHSWGWTTTIPLLVAVVALSPARNGWSVDAWIARKRGKPLSGIAPVWGLRVIQVHIMVIYISAAWHRIDDPGWIQGEMVYAAVANSMYSRLPYIDPAAIKPLLIMLSYATEIIELVAPLLLWNRRARVPVALGLMALHLGLEVSATIGYWQYMMLTLLWVFLPDHWARRLLSKVPGGPPELDSHRSVAHPS